MAATTILSFSPTLSTSPCSYAFLRLNTALQRTRSWRNIPRIRMVPARSEFSDPKIGFEQSGRAVPEPNAGGLDDEVESKVRRRRAAVRAQSLQGESLPREASSVPERLKVVALVAFVMLLCNANRIVMSVAVVPLAARYGWSSSFLGIVQSSFLWGYFFSSIAGGAMADLYGGKRVMAVGAAVWSLASFLTPWAANHSTAMLLAVRVLFGLAEGVAIPCMNKLLSGWFPSNERASAVGISMGGFHMGNLIGLLATPPLMAMLGITGPFALWGTLGYLWLSFWVPGVTSDPRDSRQIDPLELELILAGKNTSVITKTKELPDLRLLFSKLPTWAIIFANITNHWGYFVLLSWMPVYFKTVFDVNLKQAAWFSAIPWGMMALSGYIAGWVSDSLQSRYSVTLVRKIMQSIGFVGPGVSLLCLNYAKSPTTAAIWLTIGLSLSSFSQAGFMLNMQVEEGIGSTKMDPVEGPRTDRMQSMVDPFALGLQIGWISYEPFLILLLNLTRFWPNFTAANLDPTSNDIAPQYAGFLHGITNSAGTLAAIVSTIGTGYFVKWLGSFQAFLTVTAVIYFAATIFWNLCATAERVF